jgi:hypothetical protein
MGNGTVRAWTCAALVAVAACGGSDAAEPAAPEAPAREVPQQPPPPGGGEVPSGEVPVAGPPAASPFLDPNFRVWFRLDVSANPVEAEDRWVSPTSHVVRAGEAVVLDARARVVDPATGVPADVLAAWTASSPRMVAVVPRREHRVAIEVRLEGRSSVAVRHGGQTRLLTVVAEREAGGWRVEILQ